MNQQGLKKKVMCTFAHKIMSKWAVMLFLCINTVHLAAQVPAQLEPNIHIVKQGQNLYRIAKENGLTTQQILEMNNLRNEKIFPGQRLIIGYREIGSSLSPSRVDDPQSFNQRYETHSKPVYQDIQQTHSDSDQYERDYLPEDEPVAITNIKVMGRERPLGNLYSISLGNAEKNYDQSFSSTSHVSDDIQMLSHILSDQEGKNYRKVEIMPFDDIDDALDDIRHQMHRLKTRASSEDMIMINVYGTAQNKSRGVEIIPSRNVPRSNPITLDYIIQTISHISCKKILVCDANLTRSQIDDYLRKNHLDTKEVAFLASYWYNDSFSQRGVWNHGAIFQALREALAGKADMNQDGEVSLTEVDIFLNDRVMEITGNVQYAQLILNHLSDKNPVLAYLY